MKVTDFLTREEIRALTEPSDLEGAAEVAFSWGLIAVTFAAAALVPHPLTWAVAVAVLGGRQLALAILMHEASHGSLFRTRALNVWVGHWLCGAPIWNQLDLYREHHLRHHSHTGTPDDPDLGLVTPFPTTRLGLVRKLLRDLTGVAGFRRVVGLLGMDLGLLTYTASTGAVRVEPRPSWGALARNAAHRTGPVLLTNGVLLGTLALAGVSELYALWVVAWWTTFGLFLRVRAIAEHACTEPSPDPFRNTRTTMASPLARLFVAPHRVNFHLEHHLLMTVPCYRLPRLHRLLRERGALDGAHVARGYVETLRLASVASASAAT